MYDFKIKLAEKIINISALYLETRYFCQDYFPLLTILNICSYILSIFYLVQKF